MMDTARVIEALNKAVALEHAASLQYNQHGLLVRGLWRKVFADFFSAESHSALEQAYLAAHTLAEDDVALRTMLEDHIEQEQRDIEELEMYLEMVKTTAVAPEVTLRVV